MNARTGVARFTDLTIVGSPADIRDLTEAVNRAGVLVHRTAIKPAASPGDPRWRVTFRLHLHHR